MTYFTQALLAGLFTALLILWLRRPAERFGLVDHPGGRKRHSESVPLIGGLAITVGFFTALALSFEALAHYRVLFVATVMLAVVGLLDDLGEISARSKLGAQVLAAVLMTSWGNHFLTSLGDLFGRGPIALNNWGIPLTVFATVAVINGVNMIDGMDGLAGGLVAVILGFFAAFAFWLGEANVLKIVSVLTGATIGFLVFNAPHPWRGRRRVFMGDTGSLVLGFMVAWFSIELTQDGPDAVPPVVMLWVVGLVLFDVFTVTVRRLLQRRDPVSPDRTHVHHVLQRCGMSTVQTWIALLLCNALLGAIGTAGWRLGVQDDILCGAFLLVGFAYFVIFFRPGRLLRWSAQRRRRA